MQEAEDKAALKLRDQSARIYSSLAPPGYPRQPGEPIQYSGDISDVRPRGLVMSGDVAPPFTETRTEPRAPIMDPSLVEQIIHDPQAMADLAEAMVQPIRGSAPTPFREGDHPPVRRSPRIGRLSGLAPAPYREALPSVTTAGVPDEPYQENNQELTVGIQEERFNLTLTSVSDRIAFLRAYRQLFPDVPLHAAAALMDGIPTEFALTSAQAHHLNQAGASFTTENSADTDPSV